MNKKIVRFGAMVLPAIISLMSCGPTTTSTGYDGRIFDISEKQDGSLIATSEKTNNSYSLTISGQGKAKDYANKNSVPWNPIIKRINSVTIQEGIENIGDYFFYSLPLEYFILPSTVTSVGANSFSSESQIFSYGPKIENTEYKIYYYSESKPSEYGSYFYLDAEGKPQVWDITSVLFIGNSFTYYEGSPEDPKVPDFFQKIASSLNKETNIDWVIKGSHTLTKFGNKDDEMGKIVEEKLTTKKYDYVILQEQSTAPINSYISFETAVKKLKARIDETQTNCTTILYETWGSPTGIKNTKYKTVGEMEADLREAYRKCGEETDCKVHYVGKAFTNVYENHSNINIYASDERHQNNYGSYLSAAIHVKGIFKISLEGCSEYCGLDESKCKTLLSIANNN